MSEILRKPTTGFTRMPFGRDLAPNMLCPTGDTKATARIEAGGEPKRARGHHLRRSVRSKRDGPHRAAAGHSTRPDTPPSIWATPQSAHEASTPRSSPPSAGSPDSTKPASSTSRQPPPPPPRNRTRQTSAVLLVDEAHLLENSQLEELRLLTNADMDSRTLFACLLIGQPTLRQRIKLGQFAALEQRIALGSRCHP